MRWRDAWTARRARLWLAACATAAWLPLLGVPFRGWLDFSAFYAAGSLAFTPAVPRLEPVVAFQLARGLPVTPFVYPAGVALPYAPLAALPYDVAAALHVVLMVTLLVLAARIGADLLRLPRAWSVLGALAWAPAAAGAISGQNTSLALLLVVVAAAALVRAEGSHASEDDDVADASLGLLAYKPQLAAPLYGLLLLRGRWRAGLIVLIAVGVHYALGVLVTGGNLAWPADWLETLRSYAGADLRDNGWQAVSLPALGARLELLWGIPGLTITGFVAGGLVVGACVPALRRLPLAEAVALACACGLVVSPHAWVYDATLLLPAVGVLAARSAAHGWPPQDRWILAAAFALAVTWPLGGFVGVTAVLVLVLAAPYVVIRAARAPSRAGAAPSPSS